MDDLKDFRGFYIRNERIPTDSHPDECPICHCGILPEYITDVVSESRKWDSLNEIVYRCPKFECRRLFVGQFRLENNPNHASSLSRGNRFQLVSVVPRVHRPSEHSPEIKSISSGFIEVFDQASAAEAFGFLQVCGVGYRKALEFLIKDYCIRQYPQDADKIRKCMLGVCIENYVDDPKIKQCAQRAVWLGNDETHYERRYASHDLDDMKLLIRLTVAWIVHELLTEQYINQLQKK